MRFHILGIPHTQTTKEHSTCAYTQKIYKLCKMLYDRGHVVYHYGAQGSNPECSKQLDVMSQEEWKEKYGDEWKSEHSFDVNDDYHKKWYEGCARELQKQLKKKDFVLCMWGLGVKPVIEMIPEIYESA